MDDSSYFQAPALRVLWQAVTSDPMNFQSWTALLSQVESVGGPEAAHRAYEEFLRQFPLCFGYWKKYANLARRHSGPTETSPAGSTAPQSSPSPHSARESREGQEPGGGGGESSSSSSSPEARRAREVFERAVLAAPFCLELWEAFADDVVGEVGGGRGGGGGEVEDTRRVLERALEAVGDNPGAGGLWRRCVAFEVTQGGQHSSLRVTRLYERAFGHRLKDLESLWIAFKDFVDKTPWDELKPPPPPPPPPSPPSTSSSEAGGDGEATGTGGCCKVADAALAVAASTEKEKGSTDADKKTMLIKILEGKRKVSLRGRQRRESFERRLSRPHFHVKPLDDAQLSAWSQYLDFELSQGRGAGAGSTVAGTGGGAGRSASSAASGRKRPRSGEGGSGVGSSSNGSGSVRGNENIERLFERCLVPCACYWWLWERYAIWKESVSGLEAALAVANRACSPFLRWRPEALFFQAELLERLGRKEEARGVYQRVLSEVAPGLVEGACKLACFERRCGNREAASAAYRSLLPPPLGLPGAAAATAGMSKRGSQAPWEETTETTRPYLYMQLARFQYRVEGDPGGARTTFRAAVADIPGSRELWLAFLEFEAGQPQALHAGRVEAAFRMAVEEDGGGQEGAGTGSNYSSGGGGGGGDGDDDARRLTVEDRADLWEWFEEFIEDLCMDVAKVMTVRAEHRAWTRAHGMGKHEAAAATATAAAAATAASCAPGSGGGDPLQRLQAPERNSTNKNGSHGRSSRGKGHAGAGSSRTVAPPANPQQRLNAGASGGAPNAGNSGGASLAGGAGAAAGGGAGAAGDLSAAAGAAGMVGMWPGGGLMALPGDHQRRGQWSAYYQQQQQQQALQQHLSASSASALAAASAGALGTGTIGENAAAMNAFMATPAHFAPGLQSQRLQQQHIDLQVQNQHEMHQRLYGGAFPPPPQQQQPGHQAWRG